ncbi:hypothetical protein D3C71_1185020 [compost metagenome]
MDGGVAELQLFVGQAGAFTAEHEGHLGRLGRLGQHALGSHGRQQLFQLDPA